LLVLVIGVIGLAVTFLRGASQAVVGNGFGMCSGATAADATPAALTPWLTTLIDEIAGITDAHSPLTFGDLWTADLARTDPARADRMAAATFDASQRTINLEMMTTSLTLGRPYRVPFERREFFFREDEFRRLFPEEVVQWMIDHAPDAKTLTDVQIPAGCYPLPPASDFPVVVAARLSLSFPMLLSAVPLHAIDYSRVDDKDKTPECCWFSDGGICSNFPIHFFDSALPRWPTFGIDLKPYHPDHPETDVRMPQNNRGGILENWNRFDRATTQHGVPMPDSVGPTNNGKLAGFLGAIVDTAREWRDNVQMRAPGYRDRIVHVSLSAVEGGLNLDMSSDRIRTLTDRGRVAGAQILSQYAHPEDESTEHIGWRNHQWVRYRNTMAVLQPMLREMAQAYRDGYGAMIRGGDPIGSYPWVPPQSIDAGVELMELLAAWVDRADARAMDYTTGRVPHPIAELGIVPRV
jgi:hypothetical protein